MSATCRFRPTRVKSASCSAQHGTVESVSLITDRDTGRPRGFGFVEMSRADASRAIQNLNGKDMGGRPLRVNEAQERTGGGGGGRCSRPEALVEAASRVVACWYIEAGSVRKDTGPFLLAQVRPVGRAHQH